MIEMVRGVVAVLVTRVVVITTTTSTVTMLKGTVVVGTTTISSAGTTRESLTSVVMDALLLKEINNAVDGHRSLSGVTILSEFELPGVQHELEKRVTNCKISVENRVTTGTGEKDDSGSCNNQNHEI